MTFRSALVLVFLTGFSALSFELLWARMYYFLSESRAYAFAAMLCFYLLGLALGSLWSMRLQKRLEHAAGPQQAAGVGGLVYWASVAGFALAPVVSWLASLRIYTGSMPVYPFTYPLVAVVSAIMGILLPMICHFAVPPDEKVGQRMSWIYLANIVGSGMGSLLTGFVLMEYVPLRWISVLLLGVGMLVYAWLRRWERAGIMRAAATLVIAAAATPALFWQFWERMQDEYGWGLGKGFATIIESRSGVITVDQNNSIYGGGAYDGVMQTSAVDNPWLVRAYALSAMHENPEDVLVVGLSGGSWAQITAANPHVKRVTCIEINHSYREVIAGHEAVKSLLTNPKVEIIIDDGRRWLERHPERKFDAILMNTTHHWREFAGNLLSQEFLAMSAARLKPGGVFQYNATDSHRVHRTALDVFPHVHLLLNNIVITNGPFQWDNARWAPILENYTIDGRKVFTGESGQRAIQRMLALAETPGKEPGDLVGHPLYGEANDREKYRIRNRDQLEAECRAVKAKAITDDNLGHEYSW